MATGGPPRATTACCTADYLTHDDSDTKVVLTNVTSSSSSTLKGDATWIVHAGLGNIPGGYARRLAPPGGPPSER
jgi:hypothetical protein